MSTPIRLLLVEDHLVMRAALRMLLGAHPNLVVVGECSSCELALELVARHRPDIVVLDIFLLESSSLDCIPALLEHGARVLMLTGTADAVLHERALGLGARGVVSKKQPAPVLVEAIETVHSGGLWLDPALPEREGSAVPRENAAPPQAVAALTPREREVVQLIGQGLRNKVIAERLFISERTVHAHLNSIFAKLGVSDRLELAAFARRHHLLTPETTGA